MATHYIPLHQGPLLPDASGNVWFEPAAITQPTNDLFPQEIPRFSDSGTKIVLGGNFTLPPNYVGSPVFHIVWTATATSGDVVWDVDYRAIAPSGETFDPATAQEAITATATAPGTTQLGIDTAISATAGNFAAGDVVQFAYGRDGASGSDTMAAAAMVYAAWFQYSDA